MWQPNKRCWNCKVVVRGRDKLFCSRCKPKKVYGLKINRLVNSIWGGKMLDEFDNNVSDEIASIFRGRDNASREVDEINGYEEE